MLIDFTQELTDLDYKAIKTEDDKPLTLASVCEMALLANTEKTNKLTGDKKVHRAVLAQSIHTEGKVDVIAEDVAMLKEAVADAYSPLVTMRAWDILDPKVKEVKDHGVQ